MILCLGPTGAGKTLLLKRLQGKEIVDVTSSTVPTVGTTLTNVRFGNNKEVTIREVGGAMAPIWNNYFAGVKKIIYVVDASNLCQIAAAGILLYTILADPTVQNAKVLLVLSKMDASYRQMRNEALLMLQLSRLQREISQVVTVVETSAVTGAGTDKVLKWIQGALPSASTSK
ncbi:ADP-ribosylation factor-like protein 16 isoform X1 [Bacillus rossius redtenbacheri]|uniref:ADP-ribosylation factor-like protein 16 isoform X1 n=1 Tax=Bacillus rossius redtenbacheri TaxID=93214 RepID=UPI002FDD72A8